MDFTKAVSSLLHEVAHNEVSGHGDKFISMEEALFAEAQNKLLRIIDKLSHNIELEKEERLLQAIYNQWNLIR